MTSSSTRELGMRRFVSVGTCCIRVSSSFLGLFFLRVDVALSSCRTVGNIESLIPFPVTSSRKPRSCGGRTRPWAPLPARPSTARPARADCARSWKVAFAPYGREPRLLLARKSRRAVVVSHLAEPGSSNVIAPGVEIEEAAVAAIAKAFLVVSSWV
jgi:hypothetical protein